MHHLSLIERVQHAIELYEREGLRFAEKTATEMAVESGRPAVKEQAILRLMQQTNPLTNKPHSASSAEAIVETEPEYAGYLVLKRNTVADKIASETAREAARLRVLMALAEIQLRPAPPLAEVGS